MHNKFVEAIHSTNLIKLTFNSKLSGVLTRTCAPMEYGTLRRSSSSKLKYHFYSTDSSHPMSISQSQIISMNILEKKFTPEEFIRWTPNWHIVRDWGVYS
jgi:hypothetical protein